MKLILFDNSNTREDIAGSGITYLTIDADLLTVYFGGVRPHPTPAAAEARLKATAPTP